jgi:hypothetical protein
MTQQFPEIERLREEAQRNMAAFQANVADVMAQRIANKRWYKSEPGFLMLDAQHESLVNRGTRLLAKEMTMYEDPGFLSFHSKIRQNGGEKRGELAKALLGRYNRLAHETGHETNDLCNHYFAFARDAGVKVSRGCFEPPQ